MPGLDLSQVSSNWKTLQQKLQTDKKSTNAQQDLKRKRSAAEPQRATPFKKTRPSQKPPDARPKRSRMGLNGSKQEQTDVAPEKTAPSDIIPTANGTSKLHTDVINGGLHPTHKPGKYIALDCEMVGTGPPPHSDHVLARASLTNFHGDQIYDSYVLAPPGIEVKDYRTFVSGIQPHHMRPGYARTFTQVQKDVSDLLDGRILVGHALRNDLDVLLLSHPRRDIRDTSRYSKYRKQNRGFPALRHLAKSELGLEIQSGEHSSVEDARAAMMLFRQEKAGFEEEIRRRFGASRRDFKVRGKISVQGDGADEIDEEDGEMDVLDGEESDHSSDGADGENVRAPTAKKKKRKKKKRTKR